MTEKKRLTEKSSQPTEAFVRHFMGEAAWHRLMHLEEMLRERYVLKREMKFPFGNSYGWGFRYLHKKTLLLYVFFEEGGFCCTLSINSAGAPKVEAILGELKPRVQTLWRNRYPCGPAGGWIHLSVADDDELADFVRLVEVKVNAKKPNI